METLEEIFSEAKLHNHTILHLNYKRLKTLPSLILVDPYFACHLERIYLKRNLLQSLPSNVGQMKGLVELYLHSNNITNLPNEIYELSSLKYFDVSCNALTVLPSTIGLMSSLIKLILTNNKLVALPTDIGDLKQLKTLELTHNQLHSLPQEIGNCQSLTSLSIDKNRLESMPRQLVKLNHLEVLSAAGNQLIELPLDLGRMPCLKSVFVDNNPSLQCLPFSLWKHEIGANSCNTSNFQPNWHRTVICQGHMNSIIPEEIKVAFTGHDLISNTEHVRSLLDTSLRRVYQLHKSGVIQQNYVPML